MKGRYFMKHTLSASLNNTMLRPISEVDLESLRSWRNDVQLTEFLTRIDYISFEKQQKWYENDTTNPNCYTFAIDETQTLKRLVGSVALYSFQDTSAEFGRFLIGDENARGKGIGYIGTVLCLYLGFTKLGLQTIRANVHEENIAALKAYQKGGFVISGKHSYINGGHEIEIAVTRKHFFESHNFLTEIKNC